jgi:enoyl-CoA hydratase
MELLLTGDQVDAARALEWGLINRIRPQDRVLSDAMELAHRMAGYGPLALAEIKRATSVSTGRTLEDGFAAETASMDRIMASDDAREGPRAFMERRAPRYRGV